MKIFFFVNRFLTFFLFLNFSIFLICFFFQFFSIFSRETSYSLARAESLLVREKESHEQTVVILKETTEKFTSVKNELEITRKKVEILSEEKKINGKETLNVLKEMKKMEDNTIKMNKDKVMLEQAAKEQKELLQDSSRSIRL